MGKPRALKQKDKIPKGLIIDSSFENKNKTVAFLDNPNEKETETIPKRKESDVVDQQEDEPEEVQASSLEILQLKKQLEESINTKKSNRIKRKKNQQHAIIEENQLLDEDIFTNNEEDKELDSSSVSNAPITITSSSANTVNTHIRNFGMVEVHLLNQEDQNPTKKFKLSKEVAGFAKLRSSGVTRTKFGSFIAQRRPKPSRSFVVSSNA